MGSFLQRHADSFLYGDKEVPFHFWSHTTNEVTAIDTVFVA